MNGCDVATLRDSLRDVTSFPHLSLPWGAPLKYHDPFSVHPGNTFRTVA
jgi:hypothetical protein